MIRLISLSFSAFPLRNSPRSEVKCLQMSNVAMVMLFRTLSDTVLFEDPRETLECWVYVYVKLKNCVCYCETWKVPRSLPARGERSKAWRAAELQRLGFTKRRSWLEAPQVCLMQPWKATPTNTHRLGGHVRRNGPLIHRCGCSRNMLHKFSPTTKKGRAPCLSQHHISILWLQPTSSSCLWLESASAQRL